MTGLFTAVCRPVAAADTRGAFYRGWRLTAIDGTTFDLPDTKANVAAFGRPPRSGRGEQHVGYPQIRMVGLVECGTHVVFDAALGPLRTGEQTLARAVFASLEPGMLLLADRGFFSVDLWRTAAATGADLLWRVRKDIVLPVVEQLPDGSYLTEIFDQSDIHHTRSGVRVRAVEYTLAGHEGVYRLITTILDPAIAPASDLAALYAQRWEFESTLDEIKTHLGGSHAVLGLASMIRVVGGWRWIGRAGRFVSMAGVAGCGGGPPVAAVGVGLPGSCGRGVGGWTGSAWGGDGRDSVSALTEFGSGDDLVVRNVRR